jgi:protein translocase SecG subunit
MRTILQYTHVVVSILLITAILAQNRGSGLSATFGGSGNVFAKKRGIDKIYSIITICLAILFVGLAVALILF